MTKATISVAAAPVAEPDPEEQEEDDDGDEDSTQASGGAASGGGKKKKKKKKKKVNRQKAAGENGAAAGDSHPAAVGPPISAAPKVEKAEVERRFAAALTAIKNGDLWVELGASSVQDSKLKKLLEQLKKNDSVTSLNLSQNNLTDESAQSLASLLGTSSSVPGLITLDLRENNFTPQGLTILEGLKKVRRNLNIQTGTIEVPRPPPAQGTGAGGKGGAAGGPGDKFPLRNLGDSRLVRKYFQMGNDDDDDAARAEGNLGSDAGIEPGELWQQVDQAVAQGVAGIPALQPLLRQLCAQLSSELSELLPSEYDGGAQAASTCPHLKACLEHLRALETILGIVPPPVTVQYSNQPQPAVGSHRVLASEAVAHLVSAKSVYVDQRLAATPLVPRMLHLAISHPLCSTLHAHALMLLRAGVTSPVDELLVPVMQLHGWGLGLAPPPPQSATAGIPRRGGSGAVDKGGPAAHEQAGQQGTGELCPPLPSLLASRARLAVGVVGGLRNPLVGFAIQASHALQTAVDVSEKPDSDDEGEAGRAARTCNAALKLALLASSEWSTFAAKDASPRGGEEGPGSGWGALGQLCKEQEGDLGGPRAVRSAHLDGDNPLAELAGGGLITGSEILALLQGMNMGS